MTQHVLSFAKLPQPTIHSASNLCPLRYRIPQAKILPQANLAKKYGAARMDGERLVILIHGIRTRALWMDEVKPALEEAGFSVAPTSYGRFGLLRFLMPSVRLRRKAIERVVTDILTARRVTAQRTGREPASMSVIAHSFGTYVLMRIIADHFEMRWNRIILCGSVVREDFPLQQYLERFEPPILNEIGTNDYWPAVAESVGWGYGSVGSTGFNRPPVVSRWHKDFTHSQFLTREFCTKEWVPFLRNGTIERADLPRDLPLPIRLLTSLPLRWFPPALTAMVVAFSLFVTHLPFYRWHGHPALIPTDNDDVAHIPPETAPLSSFTYTSNNASAGFTVPPNWTKVTPVVNTFYWVAASDDGTTRLVFDFYHRIRYDNCLGTVVMMQGAENEQILIPDKENGCQNHELMSRTSRFMAWTPLGQVNFGQ
jgi:pimeloyl-ACP methyl ester carboxylesterase